MTTREPLYTEQDRAELIAYEIYLEGLCPKCGRPLEVCTSDEAAPGSPQFEVSQSTCRATLAIAEVRNALTDDGKKPLSPARLFGTTIRKR